MKLKQLKELLLSIRVLDESESEKLRKAIAMIKAEENKILKSQLNSMTKRAKRLKN